MGTRVRCYDARDCPETGPEVRIPSHTAMGGSTPAEVLLAVPGAHSTLTPTGNILAVLLLAGARCATVVQAFVFLPGVVQQAASPLATKEATMALSGVGEDIVSEVMQSSYRRCHAAEMKKGAVDQNTIIYSTRMNC